MIPTDTVHKGGCWTRRCGDVVELYIPFLFELVDTAIEEYCTEGCVKNKGVREGTWDLYHDPTPCEHDTEIRFGLFICSRL